MPRSPQDVPDGTKARLDGRTALALLLERPTGSPPSCELFRLASTLGVRVTDYELVARAKPRAATFLGSGRLADLASRIGAIPPAAEDDEETTDTGRQATPPPKPNYDLVLVDAHLSPRQQNQLEDGLGVPVLDRTAVILNIFESRAQTREARLEVELARLRFDLPRVRQTGTGDDRRGGGGRGERGHTNVQLEKMRIRDRIATIARDLAALQQQDDARRTQRAEVWTAALVGYTNAGKSTLMRNLTGADVLAEDKLFATLGTTVRRLHPAATPPILVCDTVGFIRALPHELVASFHSTLDQAHTARLRLLIVDASDPEWRQQLACVRETLDDSEPVGNPPFVASAASNAPVRIWNNEVTLTATQPDADAADNPDHEEDDLDDVYAHVEDYENYRDVRVDDDDLEDPANAMPAPPRHRKQRRRAPDAVEIRPAVERLVFNKCDRLDDETRQELERALPDALFVSALDAESVRALRAAIIAVRDDSLDEAELDIPWSRAELMSTIRNEAHVVAEVHHADGTLVRVRGNAGDLARWSELLVATYH